MQEYKYIFEHKNTGEQFKTNDKQHASTVMNSPSWKTIKKPKADRPKKETNKD